MMTDSAYEGTFRRHNLAATFSEHGKAQRAAERLRKDLSGSEVEVRTKKDDPDVQHAEMRDELEGVVASPVLGTALTKSQTEGAISGVVLLAGVGVLVGALLGFLINGAPGSEVSTLRWLFTWIVVPAFAGGTLGLLAGGMLKQRYAPAPHDEAPAREASPDAGLESPRETVVHVVTDDDSELEKAIGILRGLGPDRLDKFDSEGEVVETLDLGDRASS
jgi:hypothetical protein